MLLTWVDARARPRAAGGGPGRKAGPAWFHPPVCPNPRPARQEFHAQRNPHRRCRLRPDPAAPAHPDPGAAVHVPAQRLDRQRDPAVRAGRHRGEQLRAAVGALRVRPGLRRRAGGRGPGRGRVRAGEAVHRRGRAVRRGVPGGGAGPEPTGAEPRPGGHGPGVGAAEPAGDRADAAVLLRDPARTGLRDLRRDRGGLRRDRAGAGRAADQRARRGRRVAGLPAGQRADLPGRADRGQAVPAGLGVGAGARGALDVDLLPARGAPQRGR